MSNLNARRGCVDPHPFVSPPSPSSSRPGFTLLELLVVTAVIATLAGLLLPALNRAKHHARTAVCLGNLKQWGLATALYATDHDDFLPDEGPSAPGLNYRGRGWYEQLPAEMGLPPYHEMPWRTNPAAPLGRNLFICPANPRRSINNNLFHYCLNQHVDGTGDDDRPVRLFEIGQPAQTVWIFDNGKRAAVAQQNNVHTNLHQAGANFLFLDGHVVRFPNAAYWDFTANRGRTNHPDLIWFP